MKKFFGSKPKVTSDTKKNVENQKNELSFFYGTQSLVRDAKSYLRCLTLRDYDKMYFLNNPLEFTLVPRHNLPITLSEMLQVYLFSPEGESEYNTFVKLYFGKANTFVFFTDDPLLEIFKKDILSIHDQFRFQVSEYEKVDEYNVLPRPYFVIKVKSAKESKITTQKTIELVYRSGFTGYIELEGKRNNKDDISIDFDNPVNQKRFELLFRLLLTPPVTKTQNNYFKLGENPTFQLDKGVYVFGNLPANFNQDLYLDQRGGTSREITKDFSITPITLEQTLNAELPKVIVEPKKILDAAETDDDKELRKEIRKHISSTEASKQINSPLPVKQISSSSKVNLKSTQPTVPIALRLPFLPVKPIQSDPTEASVPAPEKVLTVNSLIIPPKPASTKEQTTTQTLALHNPSITSQSPKAPPQKAPKPAMITTKSETTLTSAKTIPNPDTVSYFTDLKNELKQEQAILEARISALQQQLQPTVVTTTSTNALQIQIDQLKQELNNIQSKQESMEIELEVIQQLLGKDKQFAEDMRLIQQHPHALCFYHIVLLNLNALYTADLAITSKKIDPSMSTKATLAQAGVSVVGELASGVTAGLSSTVGKVINTAISYTDKNFQRSQSFARIDDPNPLVVYEAHARMACNVTLGLAAEIIQKDDTTAASMLDKKVQQLKNVFINFEPHDTALKRYAKEQAGYIVDAKIELAENPTRPVDKVKSVCQMVLALPTLASVNEQLDAGRKTLSKINADKRHFIGATQVVALVQAGQAQNQKSTKELQAENEELRQKIAKQDKKLSKQEKDIAKQEKDIAEIKNILQQNFPHQPDKRRLISDQVFN